MIKEFCAGSIAELPAALKAGANRVELCSDLSVGGVTPTREDISSAVKLCSPLGVPVMVIIRPRGGNFVYSESEVSCMIEDIRFAKRAGASGVVIGALTPENEIDVSVIERLLKECDGLSRTFHMAFDFIDSSNQVSSLNWLCEAHFDRVLTHGSATKCPIEENVQNLSKLSEQFSGKIVIMPGGGVTWENASEIASAVKTHEVHGTKIVRVE